LRHWLNIGNASQCSIEEANYRRHERNRSEQNCTPGTSEWIFKVAEFEKWASNATTKSDPILWLSGVPGAGKSVLCSRIIEHIRQTEPSSTAVAYHFFRFDQQQSSTIEVLRVIAIQLLETLWNSVAELPDSVMAITQKSPNNFKNVVEMIKAITSSPAMSRAFVFVDGLDEEVTGRPMDVSLETLDSLISVASSFCSDDSGTVRLWLSSQPHVQISRRMATFPKITFAQQNEADIRLFFEKSLPELGDISVDEEEQNHWLTVLKDKAKGNFLWARYMIDNLVEKAESVADIKALIDHTLPPDINEYYRRQLRHISPDSRDLARQVDHSFFIRSFILWLARMLTSSSKIFSIVCYSRRPVSVSELCDAIGLLRKADPSYQGGDPKPFPRAVRKLLPPMIIEDESSSSTENRCRLFHSTVKEFLKKNPLVEGISITPSVLADVCLLYLCQPRYSGLLKRIDDGDSSEWKTTDGESIEKDHFLQYTAKYWYMHMDNVDQPSDELTDRIRAFLASPNFQTLLQLQYLYVEGQFSVFRVVGKPDSAKFLKRAFPNWFIHRSPAAASSDNIRFLEDYRHFLHEWSHLLQCGCCQNVFCTRSLFAGEIDRCLFGALGDGNFMASMQSRYLSFRFSTDDDEDTEMINPSRLCYEGYSANGKVFYLMQFA
jgi:NACHT domain